MPTEEPLRRAVDRVVVLGSANMDLVLEVDALPRAGETVVGRRAVLTPGGKGANQAVAAARAGAPTAFIGRVGDDPHGRTIRAALHEAGVDVGGLLAVPGAVTGLATVMVTADGENAIAVSPGANHDLRPAEADALRALLTPRSVLLLQMEVPVDVVHRACETGAASGAVVVLNLAPPLDLPGPALASVDVLVVNRAEAGHLLGRPVGDVSDARSAAQSLRERGPRAVVVTVGGDGAVAADERGGWHVPAAPAEVVDTTGAGDAFAGALAAALLRGDSLRSAMGHAVATAAATVQVRGAQVPALAARDSQQGNA